MRHVCCCRHQGSACDRLVHDLLVMPAWCAWLSHTRVAAASGHSCSCPNRVRKESGYTPTHSWTHNIMNNLLYNTLATSTQAAAAAYINILQGPPTATVTTTYSAQHTAHRQKCGTLCTSHTAVCMKALHGSARQHCPTHHVIACKAYTSPLVKSMTCQQLREQLHFALQAREYSAPEAQQAVGLQQGTLPVAANLQQCSGVGMPTWA